MGLKSSNTYREITLDEAIRVKDSLSVNGWLDPTMPNRQYQAVVRRELEAYRAGEPIAPYDNLIELINRRPLDPGAELLDIGASSGYYSQVLKARNVPYRYIGLDQSMYYVNFGRDLFGVPMLCADASKPEEMEVLADNSFDIVIAGGMLMHAVHYVHVIREAQRIARKQIIFFRNPVFRVDGNLDKMMGEPRYYIKDAYGLPCIEIHFPEWELFVLFQRDGWEVAERLPVFWDDQLQEGHVSYLLVKQ